MATVYWRGGATAVAQAGTIHITSMPGAGNEVYILKVGGVTIVSEPGETDGGQTGINMVAEWNASTHPYATGITAAHVGGGTMSFTADTAGVPFTIVPSETGDGSIGSYTAVTASAGPSDWSTAANWSSSSTPGGSDNVIFTNSTDTICYGLSPTAPADVTVEKTFTGKIGLRWDAFATSADGTTVNTSIGEYRETHLTVAGTDLFMPVFSGTGTPAGSTRINMDTVDSSATIDIEDAAAAGESSKHAVNLLALHSGTVVSVRRGDVGIAAYAPGETATVGTVNTSHVTSTSTDSLVTIGAGTTVTTVSQLSGKTTLSAAGTITTVSIESGTLVIEGSAAITTLNINGGTVTSNTTGTIVTLNLNGGSLDMLKSTTARTVTNFNPKNDTTVVYDPSVITLTNIGEPSDPTSISWSRGV